MGLFDLFKKKEKETVKQRTDTTIVINDIKSDEYIDDITFIRAIKHIPTGPWHQYDILLATRCYCWGNMIEWADYMSETDLENISEVTMGVVGATSHNIIESYLKNGGKCSQAPELSAESGMLSIAGISKVLHAPVKIVWINQTQVLRFFTLVNDNTLIAKYAETTIRRNFGTKDAMKLGKPIPKGE